MNYPDLDNDWLGSSKGTVMLLPSLTSWRAQYDRMRRSYTRVTGPYTSSVEYDDDLHHFVQDCWHLKDWILNDPGLAVGKAIEGEVKQYKITPDHRGPGHRVEALDPHEDESRRGKRVIYECRRPSRPEAPR